MAILGVLSAAAIPALGTLADSRRRTVAGEIERRLMLAKAWASSTGQPAGLRVNTSTGLIELLRIAAPGAGPSAMPGQTGDTGSGSAVLVSQLASGVTLSSVSVSPAGDSAVWFDFDGTPQSRTSAGVLVGPLSADAAISVTSGQTVTVRRHTGLIER